MIRRLYQQYPLQIIFAFAIIVFENFAEIAEPYVFGKAIDGLRETNRIEEEVDSSMTNIQLRQFADSVRGHLLDSLKIVDSLHSVDSARDANSLESVNSTVPTKEYDGISIPSDPSNNI